MRNKEYQLIAFMRGTPNVYLERISEFELRFDTSRLELDRLVMFDIDEHDPSIARLKPLFVEWKDNHRKSVDRLYRNLEFAPDPLWDKVLLMFLSVIEKDSVVLPDDVKAAMLARIIKITGE